MELIIGFGIGFVAALALHRARLVNGVAESLSKFAGKLPVVGSKLRPPELL